MDQQRPIEHADTRSSYCVVCSAPVLVDVRVPEDDPVYCFEHYQEKIKER